MSMLNDPPAGVGRPKRPKSYEPPASTDSDFSDTPEIAAAKRRLRRLQMQKANGPGATDSGVQNASSFSDAVLRRRMGGQDKYNY